MLRLLVILALVLGSGVAAAQSAAPVRDTTREHEVLSDRPSGFWTSNYPTKEPYRWRLLAIGGCLLAITGFLTWRLVRRTRRS